jgi:hypothetical protein
MLVATYYRSSYLLDCFAGLYRYSRGTHVSKDWCTNQIHSSSVDSHSEIESPVVYESSDNSKCFKGMEFYELASSSRGPFLRIWRVVHLIKEFYESKKFHYNFHWVSHWSLSFTILKQLVTSLLYLKALILITLTYIRSFQVDSSFTFSRVIVK